MKRILIFIYSAFFIIILANILYYISLYNKQIDYITTALDRQVQLTGIEVDEANNTFTSDLSEISYMEDLGSFFINQDFRKRTVEKLVFFYSKYKDFITGIKIFDDEKNEFTVKFDDGEWLEQQFILHTRNNIYERDTLVTGDKIFEYYLPILNNGNIKGNLVVTVDYDKYFDALFSVYNLKNYQWQWVIDNSGKVIYSNSGDKVEYDETEKINSAIENGSVGNLIHYAVINDTKQQLISSYYSTQLLQRDLALVFSSPTQYFEKYIIRTSFFLVIATLLFFLATIYIFTRFIKKKEEENEKLKVYETTLMNLIEMIPAGIIVHNDKKEILLANNMAADQFSYQSASDMKGKLYPETSMMAVNEYFAKNPSEIIDTSQFEIIRKETGDRILYKYNTPIVFNGEDACLITLIDVTELETARALEVKANRSKSEFLARLSYEIRTPLTGIIGMTDILSRNKLPDEIKDIVNSLNRSTCDLLNVRNDILDFSKIETGKLVLNEIPFNLREEIDYCSDHARLLIGGREITFKCIVDKNVPVSIISDPYRMRQMLTNLIAHSVRNTAKGEIQLHCSLLSNENGHVKLEFELQDTGKAFDSNVLKKIFGDVVNIESKILTGEDESGFGPVLANQIIKLMGGELTAESPSGLTGKSGTRIRFNINVYSNDRQKKNAEISRITSFSKIKTLVITSPQVRDDDILNEIHQLRMNLSVTTYRKSTIEQIKANLASADEKYNLIVILNDDGFNGFDVAQSLWENDLSRNLIIIMISNKDSKGNYSKSISIGVDHYLVMPIDATALEKAIVESFPLIESAKISEIDGSLKSNISALVVEDNKMNQKVIGQMLKTLGCTFDIAEDGYEGYAKTKDKEYDIIFMDLILPGIDGYESARKILIGNPDALIVALTADNMPESRSKAELSGIKEFISKPLRIEDLKKLLKKYFIKVNQ